MQDQTTRELAMFPLGTVLLPGELLPLHVFEPRYRVMIAEVLASGGELGVVLIERGHEVGGGDQRFDVACLARVVRAGRAPDGRYALVVVGVEPVVVLRWLDDDPYPRAMVIASTPPSDVESQAGANTAAPSALQLVQRAQALADALGAERDLATELPSDPDALVHQVVALFGIGPLDRQRLLAAPDVGTRLQLLIAELDEAIALAQLHPDGTE